MNYLVASTNFAHASNFTSGMDDFLEGRVLVWGWITEHYGIIIRWLEQPHILAIIFAWWITFTVVITLLFTFGGLGVAGIIGGSLAAWFQSFIYGGFTPAGGLFATLTSVGMLGFANLLYTIVAATVATIVAILVSAHETGTQSRMLEA